METSLRNILIGSGILAGLGLFVKYRHDAATAERQAAAVKIQSAFRGFIGRKQAQRQATINLLNAHIADRFNEVRERALYAEAIDAVPAPTTVVGRATDVAYDGARALAFDASKGAVAARDGLRDVREATVEVTGNAAGVVGEYVNQAAEVMAPVMPVVREATVEAGRGMAAMGLFAAGLAYNGTAYARRQVVSVAPVVGRMAVDLTAGVADLAGRSVSQVARLAGSASAQEDEAFEMVDMAEAGDTIRFNNLACRKA